MFFCIEKMENEEIDLINEQSRLGSPIFRKSALIFGGTRHQSAAFYGVEPKIGEECTLRRRWRGKGGVKNDLDYPGDKGAVHLVNKDGLSYGTLLSNSHKIKQLKMLGVEDIKTPMEVKNEGYYFNPFIKYVVTDIVRDGDTIHFVSVNIQEK